MEQQSRERIEKEIIQELINGANGLEKFECSVTTLTKSIEQFIQWNVNKQNEELKQLKQQLEK